MHALGQAVGDAPAALEGFAVVEGKVAADAEGIGLMLQDVSQLGVAQQRFGRYAADIQTDAAPILLFDNRRRKPQLGSADGAHIPARSRAQHNHVKFTGHVSQSPAIRLLPQPR